MNNTSALSAFIDRLVDLIIQPIIVLVVTAGVALFIWNVVVLIANPGDAKKRADATRYLLWGVVGIFIMVAAIGILQLVAGSFSIPVPLR